MNLPLPNLRSPRAQTIAAFIALSLNACVHAAPPSLIDLGSANGVTPSRDVLLSASGVITCSADDPGFGPYGRTIPFIWSETTGLRQISGLGGNYVSVDRINSQGTFVGLSSLPGDATYHLFLGSLNTSPVDIAPPGIDQLASFDLNVRSQVVGYYYDPNNNFSMSGYVWDPSVGFQDVGPLPPGHRQAIATGISDSGLVAGNAVSDSNAAYCFIWDSVNGIRDISAGIANNVNNPVIGRSGVVVAPGNSATSGGRGFFVWDAIRGGGDSSRFQVEWL